MVQRLVGSFILAVLGSATAFAAAVPLGTIPVGDSPFALAVSSNNQQAVVVNLFPDRNPDGTQGPNIRLLDVIARRQLNAFQLGTRLVAVALSGTTALIVNEDQDVLRIVDTSTARELAQIPVGSRPSNVAVSDQNTAIVTNGTSGNLSFVDLATRRVIGNPISVGKDPRAVAIHPAGRYAYIALGGEDAVAVLDRGATPQNVIAKVPVGKNPVAISVTPNGLRAVVANLTGNTVTVLDLTNPGAPSVLLTIAVGVQPTAMAINPVNQNIVYIANLGSPFFSVVDLSKSDEKSAFAGVVQMGASSSGIRVSSDATRLLITEFQNKANLRIYDLGNMPLDPPPAVEVPGEPHLSSFLDASGVCSFYIAEASLAPGQKEGYWGMEVLVSQGQLTGGFNLGGGFEGNGQLPGFGAFSLSSPQHVAINVDAQLLPGNTGQVGLDVALLSGNTRVAGSSGQPPLSFSADLTPGFYVVQISSLPGSPRGTFQMALSADGFSGGVDVGGFITAGVTGFGGFCIPQSQKVDIHLLGNHAYGANGAGDLILTVRDQRNVLRTVNNSTVSSVAAAPPDPPDISKLNVTMYVDASASTGGDGSKAKPLKSITTAFSRSKTGDVIFVAAGRYSRTLTGEAIPINNVKTGVTVVGAGAASTIIDGESINDNAVVIAASGVRFAGFTFRNAGAVGLYVFNSNNVTIDHNYFTSNGRFGAGSQGSRGLVVTNNVAVANQESGMAFSGATSLAISNAPANCPSSPAGPYGAYVVNNTSNDNRADGILLTQGGNYCIANNLTRNNGSSGIEFNNRAEGVAVPPLNGEILNNEITANGGVQFAFAGTGILVTEGATGDVIQGNKLSSNRPYGIGIFLNAKASQIASNSVADSTGEGILVQRGSSADTITGNTVSNNAGSGLFVENNSTVNRIVQNTASGNDTGLAILNGSTVTTVDQNTLGSNNLGMQIAASRATTVSNNTFDNNDGGGALVRDNSAVSAFTNNKIRINRGLGGLWLDGGSTVSVTASEISNNGATGVTVLTGAKLTLQNSVVNSNQADGGIAAASGSQVTLSSTVLNANIKQGIFASEQGTVVTLSGGNTVTNTQGLGLNAQTGASIVCSGSNTLSGNTGGNSLGAVSGCQ